MKYFRVNETDASGIGLDFWAYFELQDTDDIDEAISLFDELNHWVYSLDCRRTKAEEITEAQYKTGLQFNNLYNNYHGLNYLRINFNLYPTYDMAVMFANKEHPTGYVRIGHLNYHNVYKVNQNGDFMFVYHHWMDRIGKLGV
ncbi:hypothetical protein [Yersinia phage fHe-Yen9-04]|uniref:Uncharacterized protein n=2 Tax=Eneladusvirus Yen904 TaxID=2560849 RepID=A0A2C9CXT6_9CAUD|nr:hypothetical protein FDJ41_gp364 [Yersinia phage fHe-Yen9-04]SOK58641.1 hypothetical protein [Yersinia phage fHe-Yen9-04]SOK59175.1 hypothetical protein [Yersinia phage fHe-Yen9-03]VUE36410.1 hypothetical protein [Yersinia phage fHe-Yen9-04]